MRGNETNTVKSPAERYFEWSSKEKSFKYWNGEKNVNVKLPFTFMVLDQRTAIGGFNPNKNTGNHSNEIEDLRSEKLTVWSGKEKVLDNKLYEEFSKEMFASFGGKFQKNVYIAFKEGKEYKIGVINFVGSSVGAWIEHSKDNKVMEGAVTVGSSKEQKKMGNTFNTPVFEKTTTTEAAEKAVMDLIPGLKEYFDARGSKKSEKAEGVEGNNGPVETFGGDTPF